MCFFFVFSIFSLLFLFFSNFLSTGPSLDLFLHLVKDLFHWLTISAVRSSVLRLNKRNILFFPFEEDSASNFSSKML